MFLIQLSLIGVFLCIPYNESVSFILAAGQVTMVALQVILHKKIPDSGFNHPDLVGITCIAHLISIVYVHGGLLLTLLSLCLVYYLYLRYQHLFTEK